jgi:hypothetical protein
MAEWHVYATDARDGDELINGNEVAAADTGGNLPRQLVTAKGSIWRCCELYVEDEEEEHFDHPVWCTFSALV